MKKFTIKQFKEQYGTEDQCMEKVYTLSYSHLKYCPNCNKSFSYTRLKDRRAYQCTKCNNQIYPTKGTIFEKSSTPLTYWFYSIFLFTASKNGISAKELERQLGVTYKTAWRMLKQIRLLLTQDSNKLSGIVELDETYVGGKNKNRHKDKKFKYTQGRAYKDKTPVFGMLERNGSVYAYTVDNVKSSTLQPIIYNRIKPGSTIMTDEWNSYSGISNHYEHQMVFHGKGQYVDGECYTNGLENFWSIVSQLILRDHYVKER